MQGVTVTLQPANASGGNGGGGSGDGGGGDGGGSSNAISHGPGAKFLMRAQMCLHDVQCHLDHQGASTLLVDLVIKSATMPKIFSEVGLEVVVLQNFTHQKSNPSKKDPIHVHI